MTFIKNIKSFFVYLSSSLKSEILNITKTNFTVNCKRYTVRILFVMRKFQGWVLISSCSQAHYTYKSVLQTSGKMPFGRPKRYANGSQRIGVRVLAGQK
jgi:hypothetical protein